ncbi:MAG: PIN domain-containing protein [Deltaproteobacteria bacterium]|nr:PIN domain-containing protein [Deltaproteobacteria bacterium]MBW1835109.1 PIN domain-containing protein [Deltaproteobacteria bacterium]MBW2165126.1 PIN domain-containing protein [Deltaproteobacteria bacterium]
MLSSQYAFGKDVAISTITLFELEYGVEKSEYRQRSEDALAKFLLPLNLVNLDRSSTIEAATIRAQLEKKGMPIGPYDLLIAGLARSRDMTLVTNNTKEFERIVGLNLEICQPVKAKS